MATEGVCFIDKEELILVHMVLARMKEVFEEAGFTNEYFHSYAELTVRPVMTQRSKADHRGAITTLCRGISQIFEDTPHETILENPKLKEFLLNLTNTPMKSLLPKQ